MFDASSEYRDCIQADDRHITMYAAIGVGVDQTAVDDLTSVSGDFLPMSNPEHIIDAVYKQTSGLATFEGDGIPTSASAGMIAPPIEATDNPPEVGVWSSVISDADGNISVDITVQMSKAHTSAFRMYTTGPNVLAATFTFIDGDVEQTMDCEVGYGYFSTVEIMTYSAIRIHVSKLDRAFCHLRIVEMEFGSARTFSPASIAGESVWIREMDPTERTMPMDELDLTLVNVDGAFDTDNPASRLNDMGIGTPMTLGFTLRVPSGDVTIPCGRYYIGDIKAEDTRISLSAFDNRWILSDTYTTWSIDTATSFGESLNAILQEYSVPHIIDDGIYSIYPDKDHTFDDSTSILDDLLSIQQAYGIYFVPGREESMMVTTVWPGGDGGSIHKDAVYKWPSPRQTSGYNFVSIGYSADGVSYQYVEYDLRIDRNASKSIIQIVDNPLITTEARATALATRIVSRLSSAEIEVEWVGDPSLDLGDSLAIPGRWTTDNPETYTLVYSEYTFDGALTGVERCRR